MDNQVHNIFGNHLRVRACGLCLQQDQLLLVNHAGLQPGPFWAPPGGGIQYGETAKDCLVREFKEETGFKVDVSDFLFASEFIDQPLHAIELFFRVEITGGHLVVGHDPEMGTEQIIKAVKFMKWEEIEELPRESLHGIFRKPRKIFEIMDLRGYFKL